MLLLPHWQKCIGSRRGQVAAHVSEQGTGAVYYYPTCGCTPTVAAAALALYQQPAGAGYTNTCQRARRMLCDTPSAPAVTAAVLGLCRQPAGACAPPALQSRISAPAPAAVAAVRALARSSGFQERVQTPHAQTPHAACQGIHLATVKERCCCWPSREVGRKTAEFYHGGSDFRDALRTVIQAYNAECK